MMNWKTIMTVALLIAAATSLIFYLLEALTLAVILASALSAFFASAIMAWLLKPGPR